MMNLLIFFTIIAGYSLIYNFFIFAFTRFFGVPVEKFYVFYDFKFALFKVKIKETEFGLGWIPLGGYVKITGFGEKDSEEVKPNHFQKLSFFKQFLVQLAGPLSSLMIAIIVYISLVSVPASPGLWTDIGVIALIMVVFGLVYKIMRSIKIKATGNIQKITFFIVVFALYTTVLGLIGNYINHFFPLYDSVNRVWEGDFLLHYFPNNDLRENISFFIALVGMYFFYLNSLPLFGMMGFNIISTIYQSVIGEKISEKFQTVFALISLPISLLIICWFVYQFLAQY